MFTFFCQAADSVYIAGFAAALIGKTTTATHEKASLSIIWSDNARIPSEKMTETLSLNDRSTT